MKALSVGRFPLGTLFISLFSCLLWAQNPPGNAVASQATESGPVAQITFVGTYTPDGAYLSATQMKRWHRAMVDSEPGGTRPDEVPAFVDLHPREASIENFQPPAHARKPAKGQSAWANLRDNLITFAYGHEKLLVAPHQLAVDSHGRVIVSDPAATSVHILDGVNSFRLLTGADRRLIKPAGIAVDSADNIYIADPERALVVVYDRAGHFLRDIGKLGNETLFYRPIAIAICDENLYVLDSDRHALFVMDLQGHVLRRVGRSKGNDVIVDFDFPSAIVKGNQQLVVLDAGGSRISMLELNGNLQKQQSIAPVFRYGVFDDLGLACDPAGNIYISNLVKAGIRVYDSAGSFVGTLETGNAPFRAPASIWIGAGKLYVSDQGNRRIDVYGMHVPSTTNILAAKHGAATAPSASPHTSSGVGY